MQLTSEDGKTVQCDVWWLPYCPACGVLESPSNAGYWDEAKARAEKHQRKCRQDASKRERWEKYDNE